MRWDTKPDNRIRRTSPHPAPTRFEELLAGVSAGILPALLLPPVVSFVVRQGCGHGLDGAFEFWQVVVDGGLQDGVGCVEVAVGQVITHPGNLAPWDRGLGVEQLSGQCLDGLADLQQPDSDGVENSRR